MGQISCVKCGELVDEAKAFCPACGEAIIEEERRQQESKFEQMDSTVQMGKTVYGQMLSEMGLNISQAPNTPTKGEKRVEVIAPIATATPSPKPPQTPDTSAPTKKKSYLAWIVAGAIILIFLLILLIGIAGAIFYFYRDRLI